MRPGHRIRTVVVIPSSTYAAAAALIISVRFSHGRTQKRAENAVERSRDTTGEHNASNQRRIHQTLACASKDQELAGRRRGSAAGSQIDEGARGKESRLLSKSPRQIGWMSRTHGVDGK